MNKKIYKLSIETKDGEHEYTYDETVIAESIKQASAWGEKYTSEFYGEDTREEDGWHWDDDFSRCCRLEQVQEYNTIFCLDITDNETATINLHLEVKS